MISYGICLSLSDLPRMIISSCIHVSVNGTILFFFFFKPEQYSIVYTYHFIFIHSSVDGHLGCFPVLAIVNISAMSIRFMYLFKL